MHTCDDVSTLGSIGIPSDPVHPSTMGAAATATRIKLRIHASTPVVIADFS